MLRYANMWEIYKKHVGNTFEVKNIGKYRKYIDIVKILSETRQTYEKNVKNM